jgi:uncharacterized damage-inducible protein DinB
MYRKLDDAMHGLGETRKAALKLFGALTDESLNQRVADGFRSIGEIAWHIVTAYPEMMNRTGLELKSIEMNSPVPQAAAEIVAGYDKASAELQAQLQEKWDDATLAVVDDMYGEQWPRGVSLIILCNHELYHLGQITVLMRQAGLKVPGIMGPAKEEWEQYGMAAPEY